MKLSNTNGYSNWKNYSKNITLKEGENKIEFKANHRSILTISR